MIEFHASRLVEYEVKSDEEGIGGFGLCNAGDSVVTYVVAGSKEGRKMRLVTREVSLGKVHPGIFWGSFVVSPDSKRVAYVAERGGKRLVVVVSLTNAFGLWDGEEGKEYDGIVTAPIFSPDSKRVAYRAKRGDKWFVVYFVVVDGKEGKEYDRLYGGKLVFDSPNLLHALELRDDEIFHVEIEIVEE